MVESCQDGVLAKVNREEEETGVQKCVLCHKNKVLLSRCGTVPVGAVQLEIRHTKYEYHVVCKW